MAQFSPLRMDDSMPFGKFKGWQVAELALEKPEYCQWLQLNLGTKFDDDVRAILRTRLGGIPDQT